MRMGVMVLTLIVLKYEDIFSRSAESFCGLCFCPCPFNLSISWRSQSDERGYENARRVADLFDSAVERYFIDL